MGSGRRARRAGGATRHGASTAAQAATSALHMPMASVIASTALLTASAAPVFTASTASPMALTALEAAVRPCTCSSRATTPCPVVASSSRMSTSASIAMRPFHVSADLVQPHFHISIGGGSTCGRGEDGDRQQDEQQVWQAAEGQRCGQKEDKPLQAAGGMHGLRHAQPGRGLRQVGAHLAVTVVRFKQRINLACGENTRARGMVRMLQRWQACGCKNAPAGMEEWA